MAVQRLSLADITTRILQIFGISASTKAFWASDANLYMYINMVGQSIPAKVGMVLSPDRPLTAVLIDFWKTKVSSAGSGTGFVLTSGSSTGYLPVDFYYHDTIYDNTAKREIEVIESATDKRRKVEYLKKKPAGPPEAIEILGMATSGSNWQRQITIHPPTLSGVTPSMDMWYYRLPASMPGASAAAEYPDAPVQYHPLWIYGTMIELLAPRDPQYDRYKALHDEMIQAVAMQAKAIY